MKLAEAFKIDIDQMVFDNFADAGCAIDVRHRYADSSFAARVDFLCGCVGSSLIQVGDCNFRPFARKKNRYLLADPARGAK